MIHNNFDEIDQSLLQQLQEDARISNAELARRLNLSPPGLQKRLRKLEDAAVLEKYVALVNREAIGFDMLCIIQVTLQRHEPSAIEGFRSFIQDVPEVLECYHTTGEYDYLLKVILRNRKDLERFLVETLTPIPGMDKIRTSLVLSEIKSTTVIPIQPASRQVKVSP